MSNEDELFLTEYGETTMRETVWETVARLVEGFATAGSKDPTSGQFL